MMLKSVKAAIKRGAVVRCLIATNETNTTVWMFTLQNDDKTYIGERLRHHNGSPQPAGHGQLITGIDKVLEFAKDIKLTRFSNHY